MFKSMRTYLFSQDRYPNYDHAQSLYCRYCSVQANHTYLASALTYIKTMNKHLHV